MVATVGLDQATANENVNIKSGDITDSDSGGTGANFAAGDATNGQGGEAIISGGDSVNGEGGPANMYGGASTNAANGIAIVGRTTENYLSAGPVEVALIGPVVEEGVPGIYFSVSGTAFYIGGLQDFADDAAAASGGVVVTQMYRTGSIIKVRVA